MKTQIRINGEIKEARVFKTKQAADNFMQKDNSRTMLYFRAHEYFVSE
jgi:hypothetical protein